MGIKKLKFKKIVERESTDYPGFTKYFFRSIPYRGNAMFIVFEIYNNLDGLDEIWTSYCSIDRPGMNKIFKSKDAAEKYLQKKWKMIVSSFLEVKK